MFSKAIEMMAVILDYDPNITPSSIIYFAHTGQKNPVSADFFEKYKPQIKKEIQSYAHDMGYISWLDLLLEQEGDIPLLAVEIWVSMLGNSLASLTKNERKQLLETFGIIDIDYFEEVSQRDFLKVLDSWF